MNHGMKPTLPSSQTSIERSGRWSNSMLLNLISYSMIRSIPMQLSGQFSSKTIPRLPWTTTATWPSVAKILTQEVTLKLFVINMTKIMPNQVKLAINSKSGKVSGLSPPTTVLTGCSDSTLGLKRLKPNALKFHVPNFTSNAHRQTNSIVKLIHLQIGIVHSVLQTTWIKYWLKRVCAGLTTMKPSTLLASNTLPTAQSR